jgi:sec-independent protein translocase protein TatA
MLNNIGPAGLLLIAIVVLVLFGRGKIASLMGEVGKGITSFKRGIKEGSEEIEDASRTAAPAPASTPATSRPRRTRADPRLRDASVPLGGMPCSTSAGWNCC